MYQNIDLLTQEECKNIREKIFSLKDFWINRALALSPFDDLPFYYIGVASYIDCIDPARDHYYYDNAPKINKLLWENFSDLYKKIEVVIKQEFDCEVRYISEFALPGFQIYLADWYFEEFTGPKHCDFHHYLLDWSKYGINFDPEENMTFTAAIKLPKSGAGIYMWDKTYPYAKDAKSISYEEHRNRMYGIELPDEEKTYYKYEEGKIFFHTGNKYHQVAPIDVMENDDERLTLQGHAVRDKNIFYLFW